MQLLCVWKYICTSSTTQLCHDFSGRSSRDAEILLYICHEKVLGLVSSLQEERDIDGNKLEVYTGQKKNMRKNELPSLHNHLYHPYRGQLSDFLTYLHISFTSV